jgi:hypothetical protein
MGVTLQCRAQAPRCGKWPVEAGALQISDHGRYFSVTRRSAGVLTIVGHQRDVELLIESRTAAVAAGKSKARFQKGIAIRGAPAVRAGQSRDIRIRPDCVKRI